MKRICFLSHFVLCLATAAGAFAAWRAGALEAIWLADKSRVTSAIGALLAGTLAWLGVQAWIADSNPDIPADASWGFLAAELCLVLGVIGMAFGLALQGHTIAHNGDAVFEAWAAQLTATICGCAAYAILLIASHNVDRARQ